MEIDDAMSENHFGIVSQEMGRLKLLRMEFVEFEKSKP